MQSDENGYYESSLQNDSIKIIVNNMVTFISMYNEDQMGGLIRNVEFWIKDVFENLVIKK